MVQVVEEVGHGRLAVSPGPQDPAHQHLGGPGRRPQPRRHVFIDHLVELGRNTGKGEDQGPAVVEEQARGGPAPVGQLFGTLRVLGLAEIALGKLPPELAPEGPQYGGVFLAEEHAPPGCLADRLAGDVVLGGTEPAADDHRIGPVHRRPDSVDHTAVVVAHHHLVVSIETQLREPLPQVGGVRIDRLAEQQLGSHRHHLDDHADLLALTGPPAYAVPRTSATRSVS